MPFGNPLGYLPPQLLATLSRLGAPGATQPPWRGSMGAPMGAQPGGLGPMAALAGQMGSMGKMAGQPALGSQDMLQRLAQLRAMRAMGGRLPGQVGAQGPMPPNMGALLSGLGAQNATFGGLGSGGPFPNFPPYPQRPPHVPSNLGPLGGPMGNMLPSAGPRPPVISGPGMGSGLPTANAWGSWYGGRRGDALGGADVFNGYR